MTTMRTEILNKVWRGQDPFAGFPAQKYQLDLQGWRSSHRYLSEAVEETKAKVVIEIGVWKGSSVATLAQCLKARHSSGVVIAVDTWLGSSEHWLRDQWFDHLGNEHGRPTMQRQFMANMVKSELQDYVVPLPLDSLNAAMVISGNNIVADVIHLDGAHHYSSVLADLEAWWPLLRPGGILIGDDYDPHWLGVVRAFNEFFGALGIDPGEEVENVKCRIRKPALSVGKSTAPAKVPASKQPARLSMM
jgi:predicted O-methyltransferase YrrM